MARDSALLVGDHVDNSKQSQSVAPQLIEAFEALPRIVRLIYRSRRYYAAEQDAEDISQDILLSLIRNGGSGLLSFDERKASYKTWLEIIAAHYVSRYLKRLKQRLGEELTDKVAFALSQEPSQEIVLLERERLRELKLAASDLGELDRSVFYLALEGKKAIDIAAAMSIEPAAVRKRKHAIVRKLRVRLGIAAAS